MAYCGASYSSMAGLTTFKVFAYCGASYTSTMLGALSMLALMTGLVSTAGFKATAGLTFAGDIRPFAMLSRRDTIPITRV